MMRLTPVVKNLLIINGLIFLLILLTKQFYLDQILALHNLSSPTIPVEALPYPQLQWFLKFRAYQFFTYMFTHKEFMHLFFNMLGLVFAGPILESTWGGMRFLRFYVICGIGAGAFNLIIDYLLQGNHGFESYQAFNSMIGASGAIYGIMTAFGILFPNLEIRLLFFPVPIKAKYVVLGSAALVFYSVYQSLYHTSAGDNVAHLAHLGGIVVAMLLLQFSKKY